MNTPNSFEAFVPLLSFFVILGAAFFVLSLLTITIMIADAVFWFIRSRFRRK